MSVRLVVAMKALPGKAREFALAFEPIIEDVRTEPGCEQYELFQSKSDSEEFVLLERWSSPADLDTHTNAMRDRGVMAFQSLRVGPPSIERYDV